MPHLFSSEQLMSEVSPRAQSTLLEIKLNAQSQESSRLNIAPGAGAKSRMTSASGTTLPNITTQKAMTKIASNAMIGDSVLSSSITLNNNPRAAT